MRASHSSPTPMPALPQAFRAHVTLGHVVKACSKLPTSFLAPVPALLQAIYNSVILGDVRFPLLIYKQLLNRPFTFEVTAA